MEDGGRRDFGLRAGAWSLDQGQPLLGGMGGLENGLEAILQNTAPREGYSTGIGFLLSK